MEYAYILTLSYYAYKAVPFIDWFIDWLIGSLTHSLTYSSIYLFIYLFIYSFIYFSSCLLFTLSFVLFQMSLTITSIYMYMYGVCEPQRQRPYNVIPDFALLHTVDTLAPPG